MRGLAGEGAEGGGLIGGEDGGGRATDAAGARNPSGVVAGIEGQEEGLGGGADLGPDHEGGALDQLPPGGDGDDGPPGHQGRQELDPGFVLGLHFQHIVGPRQRLRGAEGGAGAENVEHLEGGAPVGAGVAVGTVAAEGFAGNGEEKEEEREEEGRFCVHGFNFGVWK